MTSRQLRLFVLMIIGSLAPLARAAEPPPQPSGQVELTARAAAAGLGYSWGEGVLTFRGKRHSFHMTGLRAGDIGLSEVSAYGAVYHLKALADFEGNYTAADAGITLGGGMSIAAMRNEKGVVIQLRSTTRGLQFTLGASGVKIKFGDKRSDNKTRP